MRIQTDCENINWNELVNLIKETGLNHYTPDSHRAAFTNSYKVVFLFDEDSALAGCGRMISDGVRQGGIFDIVVKPAYQGRGLGRLIMDTLLKNTEKFNVYLYANTGKEKFYEKFAFAKPKTAMMRFADPENARKKGFID